MYLKSKKTTDIKQELKYVKEQIKQIPFTNIDFNILNFSNNNNILSQFKSLEKRQICFGYLTNNEFDFLFKNQQYLFDKINEKDFLINISRNTKQKRDFLIEIDSYISKNQLKVSWVFSKNIHHDTTIKKISNYFSKEIQDLVSYYKFNFNLSREFTPSDFPLSAKILDQNKLEEIIKITGNKIENIYPLTSMQKGILFHNLYSPDNTGLYFEQSLEKITGNFNKWAFNQAWQYLIKRHVIFRTMFIWQENLSQPLQIVHNFQNIKKISWWKEFNWINKEIPLHENKQRILIKNFLQIDRKFGFNLSKLPLLRFSIIQISQNSYIFVKSHHHILLDGWSNQIILKELFEFYEEFCKINYADINEKYKEWIQKPVDSFENYINWLNEQDTTLSEFFWKEQLKDFVTPTFLPFKKQIQTTTVNNYMDNKMQFFELSSQITNNLRFKYYKK